MKIFVINVRWGCGKPVSYTHLQQVLRSYVHIRLEATAPAMVVCKGIISIQGKVCIQPGRSVRQEPQLQLPRDWILKKVLRRRHSQTTYHMPSSEKTFFIVSDVFTGSNLVRGASLISPVGLQHTYVDWQQPIRSGSYRAMSEMIFYIGVSAFLLWKRYELYN